MNNIQIILIIFKVQLHFLRENVLKQITIRSLLFVLKTVLFLRDKESPLDDFKIEVNVAMTCHLGIPVG